ncbi:hypothetical protein CLV78_10549 [Aliiruegeria haliotis]|uniref:HdeA/HdeB family protein n=1 Tax=Aliiruegeria haliotis TaxID=1280846 RepID=A0A2T0RPD1_9RHOB|nr:hypothetical protein [Aliiruegeria haliotis]PRY22997.1 hypothetical protein CLV78_10549 [Aliiruegeria haliotis]
MSLRVLFPSIFLSIAAASLPAQSQNMAPELFLDGKDCDQILEWASRPADVLKPELDEMLGSDMAGMLNGSMGKQVARAIERQELSDNWFARPCTFTDEQLSQMAPLREAYIQHIQGMITE